MRKKRALLTIVAAFAVLLLTTLACTSPTDSTPTPTFTFAPTNTAAFLPPSTSPPTANRDADLRDCPGTDRQIVGNVRAGQELAIRGRNSDTSWYRIAPNVWIAAVLVDNAPPPSSLAVMTDPGCKTPAPPPTPSPTPQASPTPACYQWNEAINHVGKRGCVCGPVAGTSYRPNVDGSPTWLNVGRDYPSSARFQVVIWGRNRGNFPQPPESMYRNKTICAMGVIESYRGVAEMQISTSGAIAIQ